MADQRRSGSSSSGVRQTQRQNPEVSREEDRRTARQEVLKHFEAIHQHCLRYQSSDSLAALLSKVDIARLALLALWEELDSQPVVPDSSDEEIEEV